MLGERPRQLKVAVLSAARRAARSQLFQRVFAVQPRSFDGGPARHVGEPRATYGEYWDHYVADEFPALVHRDGQGRVVFTWPGDEWGNEAEWRRVFDTLFAHVPAEATKFAEVGSGSGKYTLMTLEKYPGASVVAFDVAKKYLAVLERRCRPLVEAGRIRTCAIEQDPRVIDTTLSTLGWTGALDCLFSIDAMVHVDLQYLVAYWLSAARSLRIGGKLIMSVADALNAGGMKKLLDDVPWCFPLQGKVAPRFEWVSPDIVQGVLGHLGFAIEATYNLNHRDLFFVARLDRRVEGL